MKVFDNKMMFDGFLIEGFVCIEEFDMYLYFDLDIWVIFFWIVEKGKVVWLICDIYNVDGILFDGDLCNNLKCVLKEMEVLGFLDFNFGLELEFFLFKVDEKGNLILELNDNGGYFDFVLMDLGENCCRDIVFEFEEMGFEIEVFYYEVVLG